MKDCNSKEEKKSIFGPRPSAAEFYGIQLNQAELEPKYDVQSIRLDGTMKRAVSEKFITLPHDYPDVVDFEIAREAPTIDFSIVQNLEPWFLENDDEIHVSPLTASRGFAMWSGFGAIRRGVDGSFYYSVGNHRYYGGNSYMLRYDPVGRKQSVCFELKRLLDLKDTQWADGKIHGNPDMDDRGNMYVSTFSGPRPLAQDLDSIEYSGGHVVTHNILTGESRDLGVPLAGDTWAYSAYSPEMNVLIAVGQAKGMVMVYDTRSGELIFGGYPPPEIKWWMRCLLADPDTGKVFSSNVRDRTRSSPLISWERKNNTFREYAAQVPTNPVTGKAEPLRAHTVKKDVHGNYWCFDEFGLLFSLNTETLAMESYGLNWGSNGMYTANLVMSPKGRYIYYLPGAHNRMHLYGTPLVQFDVLTKTRKVLAFLNDYYCETYHYNPFGAYGIEMDEKGESVFFYTNGLFSQRKDDSGYGRPAIFHVHIPESERIE